MVNIKITQNEENQRLDRFLKKYLKNAPLSRIYKLIRKDVKVNGKRGKPEQLLHQGDEIGLYMKQEELDGYIHVRKSQKIRRQFRIAYEDDDLLIVEKPFGLLVHGDAVEKKNTLSNQVCGYLQETGCYVPGRERTFVPSPVNRLDRNTTGLVIFGKNNRSLQLLNGMIRQREQISKYYLTIVTGEMTECLYLQDYMTKDAAQNRVTVLNAAADGSKRIETAVRPLSVKNGYTLAEVDLITGRTHQIRAHLAQAGFSIIGDSKYGKKAINQKMKQQFGLTAQLLHAYRLQFNSEIVSLPQLAGRTVTAELPNVFAGIKRELFD